MTKTKQEVYDIIVKYTTPKILRSGFNYKMYIMTTATYEFMSSGAIPMLMSDDNGSDISVMRLHLLLKYILAKCKPEDITVQTILYLCFLMFQDLGYSSTSRSKILECDDFYCFIGKCTNGYVVMNLCDDQDVIIIHKELPSYLYKINVPNLRSITKSIGIVVDDVVFGQNNPFRAYPYAKILNFIYFLCKHRMMRKMNNAISGLNFNPGKPTTDGDVYLLDDYLYGYRRFTSIAQCISDRSTNLKISGPYDPNSIVNYYSTEEFLSAEYSPVAELKNYRELANSLAAP